MKYILTSLISLQAFTSMAQTKADTCHCAWEKKADSLTLVPPLLKIREAFEDITEKQKPAKTTVTWPEGAGPTFMVNAGLSLSLNHFCNQAKENQSRKTVSLFSVYNRNTLIAKYQEMFKAGAGLEYQFGKTRDSTAASQASNAYGYWNTTFQYVNNVKDTAKSLVITSYISPFRNSKKTKPGIFLNSQQHLFDRFSILLSPQGGFEYQNTFRAADTKKEGGVLRTNLSGSVSLFVLKKLKNRKVGVWPNMFELRTSYTLRNELINMSETKDASIPLFKADFIYYPTFNSDVSIGLSYNDGADPIAGLADQKFWMLSIQIKK